MKIWSNESSFKNLYLDNFREYLNQLLNYPLGLIFGFGFAGYGYGIGGDTGFIETLARFGLPIYTVTMLFLLSRIATILKELNHGKKIKNIFLFFPLIIFLMVIIFDFHYSVWSRNTVIPLIFVAFAYYDHYFFDPIKFKNIGQQLWK